MIKAECGQSEQEWCKEKTRNERKKTEIQGDNTKAPTPLAIKWYIIFTIQNLS